jgi:uncharacterized phage protein (TIGR01671 family)
MRTIKFKYLANYKDSDGVIHWHKEVFTLPQIEQGFWQGGLDACFTSNPENTYKLQYTGLHDKNGKEIYENDIVKMQVDEYRKTYTECRVGWHIDGYKCFYGLDNEKKWDNGIPYEDWSDDVDWVNCIVIGNIYENPELIK